MHLIIVESDTNTCLTMLFSLTERLRVVVELAQGTQCMLVLRELNKTTTPCFGPSCGRRTSGSVFHQNLDLCSR